MRGINKDYSIYVSDVFCIYFKLTEAEISSFSVLKTRNNDFYKLLIALFLVWLTFLKSSWGWLLLYKTIIKHMSFEVKILAKVMQHDCFQVVLTTESTLSACSLRRNSKTFLKLEKPSCRYKLALSKKRIIRTKYVLSNCTSCYC